MKKQITVTVNGKKTYCKSDTLLSEIIGGEKPCGGHGKCGKCKVIARGELSELTEAEIKHLSSDEQKSGIRLACLTHALGNCEIETSLSKENSQIITDSNLPDFIIDPIFKRYGIAIDIGTTTIAAKLFDVMGNELACSSSVNPQQKWGADVISRIEESFGGHSSELSDAIRKAINSTIKTLANDARISSFDIDALVITGNTVMLSLLTEECIEPFSHAPFDVKRLFGEYVTAASLQLSSLNNEALIYLPRCISAFVGADTVCAIIATELCQTDPAMLADIGTNGEIALWNKGSLAVSSTAAGPAFEGVGISMGMRGADGAIDKVEIENGKLVAHVIGESRPVGICGSGLVDTIACMLELGIIDESGYLEDEKFTVKEHVSITPKDIRMLQLAKSAICAGLLTLLDIEKLKAHDIKRLYIAGGFGNYISKKSATKIGLFPNGLAENSKSVGNAALGGASMILLNTEAKYAAETIANNAKAINLSTKSEFSENYMSSMLLEEI